MDVSLQAKTKPLSSLSAFSYIPPRRRQLKDMSYFNRDLKERSRSVPVLSSSEYGRHPIPVLYAPGRQHAQVACIKTEFYTKNGLVWNVEEGYGSVVPI
ncbi:hypothetical protein JOB18_000884 [Solea senegalensis]|uniref:Uncharacterized protein n=1 Tax=Solea senegalensis TaxID=28829 RepID=A0AAV6R3X4_SOLSE|nr:hypothetical protein JOB18_000884 [Solea senegalensis]